MANTLAAKKALRQSEASRKDNKSKRRELSTRRKTLLAFIEKNDKENALKSFQEIQSLLAKFAQKGNITKGRCKRVTSRLSLRINQLA